MKIAIFQLAQEWENPKKSAAKIDKMIKNLSGDEKLLIFPEMSLTGFTMSADKFAEEIDGFSTIYFMNLAKKTKSHIFAGIIEKDGDKFYNSLVHFDNKGLIIARYRKIHLFSLADEHKYYSDGDEKIITKIEDKHFGLSICYDLRFPELYRHFGKNKVEVIVDIASWPEKRIDHWNTLLKARAIENQCYVIGVNRTGSDKFLNYCGNSVVFNPVGESLCHLENEETVFSVELDFEKLNIIRTGLPFLNDIKLI